MNFDTPLFLLMLIVLLLIYSRGSYFLVDPRKHFDIDGQNELIRSKFLGTTYKVRKLILLVALALLIVALSGPSWGSIERPLKKQGIDVVMALDVSRSMTATDIAPSRLERSIFELQKLLQHLDGDRVGLVLFAGNAIERVPLTLDLDALSQLINQAQSDFTLVTPGTDLDDAISKSLALLNVEDSAETQSVVIISDGEDIRGVNIESIQQAKIANVVVHTVAVGTELGGLIPNDVSGVGATKADEEKLRDIAEMTGGTFFYAQDIESIVYELHEGEITEFQSTKYTVPNERSSWFLSVVVFLLTVDLGMNHRLFIRKKLFPWGTVIFIVIILLSVGCVNSTLSSAVKNANQEYLDGNFELALSHYLSAREIDNTDPLIAYHLSNVLHYLGRNDEASVVAQQALMNTDDSDLKHLIHYAMGTYAVERGMLENARDHYIRSLQLQPKHYNSKQNLELVLNLLSTREIVQQESMQTIQVERRIQQRESDYLENQLADTQFASPSNNIGTNSSGGLNADIERQEPIKNIQVEKENRILKIEESVQNELINDSNVLTRSEANNLIFLIQRWNELQRKEEVAQELFTIEER